MDDRLWVVVRDRPSAYFVSDQTTTSYDAIEFYRELMKDWGPPCARAVN